MMLLDTSVPVLVTRNRKRMTALTRLLAFIGGADFFVSCFTELELLQGARDEADWAAISTFLSGQDLVDPSISSWSRAARINFELKRKGLTVHSAIDCAIAQIALERNLTLLHNDRDFDTIATIRPLKHTRLDLDTPAQ